MKLKKFLEALELMIKSNPKILELDIVYSIDDEGNEFKKVYFEPTIGIYNEDEGLFYTEDVQNSYINAICIN